MTTTRPKVQLKVVSGPERGRVEIVEGREIHIGRQTAPGQRMEGWLLLPDDSVSRLHAMLSWDESLLAYVLHHRSRTNPTLVNGVPAEIQALVPGDRLRLGQVELEFWETSASVPTTTAERLRVDLPDPLSDVIRPGEGEVRRRISLG